VTDSISESGAVPVVRLTEVFRQAAARFQEPMIDDPC
jgi:hypothetical protein